VDNAGKLYRLLYVVALAYGFQRGPATREDRHAYGIFSSKKLHSGIIEVRAPARHCKHDRIR
jgi:hypothetical protein